MLVPRSTKSGNHRLSVSGTTFNGAARDIVIGVKVAKLKKQTVRLFRVYSTKMRPKLRKQANRIVKQNPALTAVHCKGFERPSKATNPKDVARATKRAK